LPISTDFASLHLRKITLRIPWHALHSEEKKLEALIGRLERWLNKPI
jgi:hypothetical protein